MSEQNTAKVGDTWFRYEEQTYSIVYDADRESYGTRTELKCRQFEVVKVTAKGVWIRVGWIRATNRFVLLSARRRFAAPTQQLALESFLARKHRQIGILMRQINRAERMADEAELRLQALLAKEQAAAPSVQDACGVVA